MPTVADHISLANKNHNALMCVAEAGGHPEWVATIAFYKALQVVQAMLAAQNISCHDHRARANHLKTRFPDIYKHYRPLWNASTIARYLHDQSSGSTFTTFTDFCPEVDVYMRVVWKRLKPVEDLVVRYLPDDEKRELSRVVSKSV